MPPPMQQVPGAYRRRIGDCIVTVLDDGYVDLPFEVLRGMAPEEARGLLDAVLRPPRARVTINAFAIHHGTRVALIDAGAGDTIGPTAGRLPASLAAAGVMAEAVDTVLLTHLHSDHANGLLGPDGTPNFPRAEIIVHPAELAHWLDDARLAAAAPPARPAFATARRIIAACRDRIREVGRGEVFPGVFVEALPGHTPGHTGFRIVSGPESLLVWGDIAHLPDIQVPRPEVAIAFDVDKRMAIETRRRVLDMAAMDRTLVAGMHLQFPAFARVRLDGSSYRLVPEP